MWYDGNEVVLVLLIIAVIVAPSLVTHLQKKFSNKK